MKEIFFLLIFVIIYNIGFSQDIDITAKTYYINAEEAYNKGTILDNDECIAQLKKAEQILGAINPKILYLKIKAMWFCINNSKDGFYVFDLDTSLKLFFAQVDVKTYSQEKYVDITKINIAFQDNIQYYQKRGYFNLAYKVSENQDSKYLLKKAEADSAFAFGRRNTGRMRPVFEFGNDWEKKHRNDIENLKRIELFKNDEYLKQAFRLYMSLAGQNDTAAIRQIAHMYHTGEGVQQSPDSSSHYYYILASVKSSDAMFWLGTINNSQWLPENNGTVINSKPNEALVWYHRSANYGNIYAMKAIARFYRYGTNGLDKDVKVSEEWEKKADAANN